MRITSSNYGKICKATAKRNLKSLATNIVSPKTFNSKATSHGIAYESVAIEKFGEMYTKSRECGLFVNSTYPWLGASPDGVVDGKSIVEVKCPYSFKDSIISSDIPYLIKTNND